MSWQVKTKYLKSWATSEARLRSPNISLSASQGQGEGNWWNDKNRQKAIFTGLPIFLGEGVAAHLNHKACRWPLRDVTSYEKVNSHSFEHCTLLEDFRNEENEYHF